MRSTEAIDTIAIIGGGISGLSSAFYLQKEARESGRKLNIILLEQSNKLGGKINTLTKDNFVIEKGPDSFLSRKRAIIDLAHEVGLADDIVSINPQATKTYIVSDGKLHTIPKGLVLGIPTDMISFLQSSLISASGKWEALKDIFKPAQSKQDDESLGLFLERRIGRELVEKIAEPLLAGIYAGDLRKLSLQATFPYFSDYEQQYGSIILGSRQNRRLQAEMNKGQLPPTFMTFKKGLSSLVNAVVEQLTDVDIRLNHTVDRIDLKDSGYLVQLKDGASLPVNSVIITTPAFHAKQLLSPFVDVTALDKIRYVSVANVVLAFNKAELGIDFDGSGFLVPHSENMHITACTWTSKKWLHTAPEDKVLMRCYVGHSEDQQSILLDDDALVEAVKSDIKKLLPIKAEPIFTEITRLYHSMPQYPIGHVDMTKQLKNNLEQKLPGVLITGAAFDGVGLPDCIRQGKDIANQALQFVTKA